MEFWFSEFHTPDVKHSIRVNKQLYSKQSDYQRIDIFETPEFGRVLTLDGNVMLTERDEFIYDEMIVHVPMAVHKEAKDILVIGAGDGGVVRELTRYDRVERIDLVEMDPQVVEACRAYLPGNACRMDDRRVHIYFENALKYIRRCEEEYDLIIVDSSDPFGPSEGLFTREFYGSCFNALKEDGIMVNQQGSPFYTEDASAMQRSHKRIASTFPVSRVYQAHIPTFAAGYWLFGFASKKYHPIDDLDADAWKALNLRTRYYTTRLHVGAFYLPAFLEKKLREVAEFHPNVLEYKPRYALPMPTGKPPLFSRAAMLSAARDRVLSSTHYIWMAPDCVRYPLYTGMALPGKRLCGEKIVLASVRNRLDLSMVVVPDKQIKPRMSAIGEQLRALLAAGTIPETEETLWAGFVKEHPDWFEFRALPVEKQLFTFLL